MSISDTPVEELEQAVREWEQIRQKRKIILTHVDSFDVALDEIEGAILAFARWREVRATYEEVFATLMVDKYRDRFLALLEGNVYGLRIVCRESLEKSCHSEFVRQLNRLLFHVRCSADVAGFVDRDERAKYWIDEFRSYWRQHLTPVPLPLHDGKKPEPPPPQPEKPKTPPKGNVPHARSADEKRRRLGALYAAIQNEKKEGEGEKALKDRLAKDQHIVALLAKADRPSLTAKIVKAALQAGRRAAEKKKHE